MKKYIGIDFGTSNTFIYVYKKGLVYNEPTLLALNTKNHKILEIGYLASKLIGRTPDNVKVLSPVKNGHIANLTLTIQYLKKVFSSIKLSRVLRKSTIVFSAPNAISIIEKRALLEAGYQLGAKKVVIESVAKLSAIGSGINIESPKGCLAVNIGGGISDIAVLSNGNIIITKSANFSGNLLDEAILRYLRNKHHLIVGTKAAEFIKMKIGSVEQYPENRLVEVTGRDIISSLPHSVIISTAELKAVLLKKLDNLTEAIVDCLEMTPPELASDVMDSGIVICGGTALLSGLREQMEKALNIPVRISPEPLNSVVLGMKIYINKLLSSEL